MKTLKMKPVELARKNRL